MTHSFEIGVRVNFYSLTRDDGKFLMAHISKRKLSSFPGVTPNTVPEDLRLFLQPVKDENGVSPLLLCFPQ